MILWFNRRNSNTKRKLTGFLFSLVLITTVTGSLLIPRPAKAQLIVSDVASAASWVWQKIQSAATWAWDHGAAMAYQNALRTFTTQVAYDSAVMLASGGEGQTPLFSTKSLSESITNAYRDAGGDFLDTLMTGAGQHGFLNIDICQPTSPTAQLIIGISNFNELKPRQPRCSLTDIQKNWEKFLAPENRGNILKNVGAALDPMQNDLGIALTVQQNLVTTSAQSSQIVWNEQQLSQGGFLPLTETITKRIKTPVGQVADVAASATEASVNKSFGQYTGDVLADALGVFTNTLASRMLKKLLQTGSVPSPSRIGSSVFSGGSGGVEYALEVNSDIKGVNLAGSSGVVDIISEFSNCPKDPGFYTPVYACTITQKFAQALRKADEGQPLTVKEAIDGGYINGDLPFIRTRPRDETFSPSKAWYLSDIRKLRLARIVPLGWELAAEKFVGLNVTLKQVMDGFSTGDNSVCDGGSGETFIGDISLCGLVDPNWVLRAPPAQCRIEANGQLIGPTGPDRLTSCVDYQHCIVEKSDGSCQAWGYCTREQNIWRFSGKSCELPEGSGVSPWPTCQSFKDSAGNVNSYLVSSLTNYDDGVCSDAASCRWYSAARNLEPEGQDDLYLPNKYNQGTQNNINTVDFELSDNSLAPRFYLKNVDKRTCTTKDEGCTKLLQLTNIDTETLEAKGLPPNSSYADQVEKVVDLVTDSDPQYSSYEQLASASSTSMRQAPDYLNCYDTNPNNNDPQCVNYLQLCNKLEVGCELYTPKDGSPAVPGQVITDNVCPAECNGFNTYQQTSSFFENFLTRAAPVPPDAWPTDEPAINFIPATGKSCSSTYDGCEEFTNIEQNERKEYYSEMRQCVRPEDNSGHTYYTWIGSDLTGYQLKTWELQAEDAAYNLSGPYTTDGSGSGNLCGGTASDDQHDDFGINPDCKEFYITDGPSVVVYYRYESKVVYVSTSCNRYRATSIAKPDCPTSGGEWNDTEKRCYYRAIPGQGKVCPASANGCREYRGPTAGNVRLVFPVSTFGDVEPGVNADSTLLSGWQGGSNSNQSTSAFGHSLWSGSDKNIHRDITGQVTQGKQYILTFWAKEQTGALPPIQDTGLPLPLADIFGIKKASAQTSRVWDFISENSPPNNVFTPTDEWAIYNFGPVTLTGDVSSEVQLDINGTKNFYIDNITFREVQDTFYVRKNTWVTPNTCYESVSGDPVYLRCSAYNTRDQQTVYLTGFNKICRNEAIGCRALIDTHNSTIPKELSVTAGDQEVTVPKDNVVYRVYDSKKSCTAQYAGCKRLGQPVFDSSGAITGWSDVYTVLNPDTFDYGTNPAASPLCSSQQSMCQLYTDGLNVTHVFKDSGEKVCEYKNIDATVGYAWYKKGTNIRCNLVTNPSFELLSDGRAADGLPDTFTGWQVDPLEATNTLEAVASFNGGQYWGSNVLSLGGAANGIYTKPSIQIPPSRGASKLFAIYAHVFIPPGIPDGQVDLNVSCSPGLCTTLGGNFNLNIGSLQPNQKGKWLMLYRVVKLPLSSINPNSVLISLHKTDLLYDIYIDEVEMTELPDGIPEKQALEISQIPYAYECPSDQAGCTAYRDPVLTNKTYYYLNNTLDKGNCNGNVSAKEGCILFNDVSNSTLTFNANLTYQNSANKSNGLVAPSTSGTKNTNLVLRVQRDRSCAEWLSCNSESLAYNPQTKKYNTICYSLGACNQLSSSGDVATCANWIVRPTEDRAPLDIYKYQQKGNNWSSLDYSGYSIADTYPIELLSPKEYGTSEQSDIRLTYLNPTQKTCGGALYNSSNGCIDLGANCTLPGGGSSTCQNEDLGLKGEGSAGNDNTYKKLCRAYPESDSPFSSDVVNVYSPSCPSDNPNCGLANNTAVIIDNVPQDKDDFYSDANVCQKGEACDCSYEKVTYSNGDKLYYSINSANGVPPYFTYDAQENGMPINSYTKSRDVKIGLKGFCLEKDTSKLINAKASEDEACLTWLPIDVASGEASLFEYSPEAGYAAGETLYCSVARGNEWTLGGEKTYKANIHQLDLGDTYTNACGRDDCKQNVGSDLSNYYFPKAGYYDYDIGGWVTEGIRFNMPAYPAQETESHKSDLAGIRVGIRGWYGYGWGGGMYSDSTYLLSEVNNWCFAIGAGSSNACADLPGNNLVTASSGWTHGCADNGNDYTAIKAVFSQQNKFIGYNVMVCDGSGDTGGAKISTTMMYKEVCSEVASSATPTSNKAWTDRLLRLTNTPFNALMSVDPNATKFGFTSARKLPAYGKLNSAPAGGQALILSDAYTTASNFRTIATAFSCEGGCGGLTPTGNLMAMCIWPESKIDSQCSSSQDCSNDPNSLGICTGYFSGTCDIDPSKNCITDNDCGTGNKCINYQNATNTSVAGGGLADFGRRRVLQLFAQEYGLYNFSNASASEEEKWNENNSTALLDISCGFNDSAAAGTGCLSNSNAIEGGLVSKTCWGGTRNNESCNVDSDCLGGGTCNGPGVPHHPMVKSVVINGNESQEGPDGFTVKYKGQYYTSSDATPNNITINSSDTIQVMFYAYNSNGQQMPLRKIFVDWGDDDSSMSGAESYYKNHKHNCKSEGDPGYNWGDSNSACIEDSLLTMGYFYFSHTYTKAGTYADYPRIYVEDNWGWCTIGHIGNNVGRWGCVNAHNNPDWIDMNGSITVSEPPTGGGGGGLTISPASIVTSCGGVSGPYSPPSTTYTLTNTSTTDSIDYNVHASNNWLLLTNDTGTILPGASVFVSATIDPAKAQLLGIGSHDNGIYFATSSSVNIRVFRLNIVSGASHCTLSPD